ncbi:MAG: YCF48-related protein [Bacteroidota bacterium]
MHIRIGFFLFVILVISACGKNTITTPFDIIQNDKDYDLFAVDFSSQEMGHVVGGNTWFRGIYGLSENGGETWTEQEVGDKQLNGIHFTNNYGVCVGIDGFLFEKKEIQNDWEYHRLRHWHFLRDVAVRSPNEMLAVGGVAYKNGAIYHMNQPWNVDSIFRIEQELSAVTFIDENKAIAVGYGVVLLSKDKGYTWELLPIEGDFFKDVIFIDDQIGYILGFAGTVLKSTNGGLNWDKIRNPRPAGENVLRAMDFKDANLGYLVGDNGRVFKTTNGGESWSRITNFPDKNFNDIAIVDNQVFIVGEDGIILKFSAD